MAYTLRRLAPGSYDVLLDRVIIAGLVRAMPDEGVTWTAELLVDLSPHKRPKPFTKAEHTFQSFEAACAWLGSPQILNGTGGADLPGQLGMQMKRSP